MYNLTFVNDLKVAYCYKRERENTSGCEGGVMRLNIERVSLRGVSLQYSVKQKRMLCFH